MRKWLSLLALLILISSCEEKEQSPLDGIWITAYTQLGNSKKFPSFSRNLLEFQDTSVLITAMGDLASFKFTKIEQRHMTYALQDTLFNLAGDDYHIQFGGDSLALRPVGSKSTLIVFKRLPESLKNTNGSLKILEGKYSWSEEEQELEFVGDSIVMIKKALEGMKLPAEKWSVLEYKSYRFFNIHNELFGLAFIKSANKDSIELVRNHIEMEDIVLKKKPCEVLFDGDLLEGSWKSTNQRENEGILFLKISENELSFEKDSLKGKLNWDLNQCGNKLYFPSIVGQKNGVWSILALDKEHLSIELFGLGSLENNISIVEFERAENP